jgi:nucleotide-binding universal stress UspA family protein
MKNILIPTDFSDNSWNAIEYGLALFRKVKCTFHLVYVNPIAEYSGGEAARYISSGLLEKSILKESQEKLDKLLHKISLEPLNPKHEFQTIACYDFFTDRIRREVLEKKIDLIIMGTKGASGLKAVAMGTNTGNVITKVKCPVLAVPENAVYNKPREIAFPTDYNLNYNIRVLDNLKEVALMTNAAIRFLYISKAGEELSREQMKNREFLGDYFTRNQHSFHKVTGENLETAVQCFTESRVVDMIAMVAKNLNFLQRLLFRPRVEKISYHITIPFLVLHE